jgi:hypothetical protein
MARISILISDSPITGYFIGRYYKQPMPQDLTSKIIRAVADNKGVEPAELAEPLGEYVDLDAVNQLAEHDNSTWTLTFELPEHSVTVMSDGVILVDEREQDKVPS